MGFFSRLKGGYKDIAGAISGWFTGKGSGTWLDGADLDDYITRIAGSQAYLGALQSGLDNVEGIKNVFKVGKDAGKLRNPDFFKKTYNDAIESLKSQGLDPMKISFQSMAKTEGEKAFAKSLDAYKGYINSADKVAAAKTILGRDEFNMADRYNMFFGRSGDIGKGRRGAVRTTVAGGMVGGRLLSGGSLTHDKNGNRDIVGIPFV